MQFLNPTYLWGLLLILIPVIIHLFQLRKYKLVYFSSLKFLKQLDIEQKRKSRIRDLLLLLTRILLISMLVLAFAHPYFPDETNFDGRTQTVGIYIDNSLSMQNEIGGQSLFDHARSGAAALVDKLPSDTRYYLLHNSELFNSRFPLENKDVKSNLEILRPSPASSDLGTVIERFRQILSARENSSSASLHIFSDLQKSFFNNWELKANPEFNTRLNILPSSNFNNIFIDSCWFSSSPNNTDKRLSLEARINNTSDQDLKSYPVHLSVQDSLVAQETVDIAAYSSSNIEFSFNIDQGGWKYGRIEIRDYPVSFDNQFHFAYYTSEEIPVLQVYSDIENQNLRALFESDVNFDYFSTISTSIPYQDLSNFQMVILNSPEQLSPNLKSLLQNYITGGGNLFILPPDEGSFTELNRFLQEFQTPLYGNLIDRKASAGIPENMKSFYRDISLNPNQQVEWPEFSKFYRLVGDLSNSEALIQTETGQPLISRTAFGNGFISLSAAPYTDDFTNFQVHPLFIPFFYYLANTGVEGQKLYNRIGNLNPVFVETRNNRQSGPFKITEMNGNYSAVPEQARDPETGRMMFYLGGFSGDAGIMKVTKEDNDDNIALIATNYQRHESELENFSTQEIQKMIGDYSLNNISINYRGEEDTSGEMIRIKGKTFSLISIVLLLGIIFLVIESLFHRFKT